MCDKIITTKEIDEVSDKMLAEISRYSYHEASMIINSLNCKRSEKSFLRID